MALHRARQADAERLRGELQWPTARRMPQRDLVHLTGTRPVRARPLAAHQTSIMKVRDSNSEW